MNKEELIKAINKEFEAGGDFMFLGCVAERIEDSGLELNKNMIKGILDNLDMQITNIERHYIYDRCLR